MHGEPDFYVLNFSLLRHLCGKRVREFQPEVNRLAADAASGLRGIDFLLVALKLCPLRAAVIGACVRLARLVSGHGVLLSTKRTRAFGVRLRAFRA